MITFKFSYILKKLGMLSYYVIGIDNQHTCKDTEDILNKYVGRHDN
jgi:hypothetical protein